MPAAWLLVASHRPCLSSSWMSRYPARARKYAAAAPTAPPPMTVIWASRGFATLCAPSHRARPATPAQGFVIWYNQMLEHAAAGRKRAGRAGGREPAERAEESRPSGRKRAGRAGGREPAERAGPGLAGVA